MARAKVCALPRPYAKDNFAAEKSTSFSVTPMTPFQKRSAVTVMLECTCTAAFGVPVEPEEYSQKQGSSEVVGAGESSGKPFARTSSNAAWPDAPRPETMTCFRNGRLGKSGANWGSSCSETTSALARLSESMYS